MPEDYDNELEAAEKEAEEREIKKREANAKRKKILAAGVLSVAGALALLGSLLLILSAADGCTKNLAKAELEKTMTRRYN
jgi:cell division septal protein FtsQ